MSFHKRDKTRAKADDTLRSLLLGSLVILPLVPFLVVVMIGGYYFYSSVRALTKDHMSRIVSDHRQMIESFLQERQADLEMILNSYPTKTLTSQEELQTIFIHLQRRSPAFVDLGIFDDTGIHLAYCGPHELSGKNYHAESWFKEVLKNNLYISDVFLGFRQTPHFVIAVAREENQRKWVARVTIDSRIFSRLVEDVRIGATGEAYIINANGSFQTEKRSGGELMTVDPNLKNYFGIHSGIETFLYRDNAGEAYLGATAWFKNHQWCLVVRQKKTDAFHDLNAALLTILLSAGFGGSFIVFVAFYLTNHIVVRMADVNRERENLEQQLIGASRLAEVGEMAAGFAHEINNPLQIMKGELALIESVFNPDEEGAASLSRENAAEAGDALRQIGLQIDRCARITQSILKFGRQGQSTPQEIDLRTFLPEVVGMIAPKATVADIKLAMELADTPLVVKADPAQLQQVLVNMLNNAVDAIEESGGNAEKRIAVTLRGSNNGTAEIRVTDTGVGINSENMDLIFTPFFTTKPPGKGTGLGLSVCYGIIEKMGGGIRVESQKNQGTTFIVSLPLHGR